MPKVPTIEASEGLGARFRWVRKHLPGGRQRTQFGVAEDLAFSISHYGRIEAGTQPCSEDFARKFCAMYGVNLQWLITGEGPSWARDVPTLPSAPSESTVGTGRTAMGGAPKIEMTESTDEGHGRTDVNRRLVDAAVRQTRAAMMDQAVMASIEQLCRHLGQTEEEVLSLLVWAKVTQAIQQ